MPFVPNHVVPHNETDAADQYQRDNHKVDHHVSLKGDKGRIFFVDTHQVKPAIAEGRDCVKDREINPPRHSEARDKAKCKQYGARKLYHQRSHDNFLHKPHHTGNFQGVDTFMELFPLVQPDSLFQQYRYKRAKCQKAKSPHLYQAQDDHLSKRGPVLVGVRHHKPRHAGRRSCRKEGI